MTDLTRDDIREISQQVAADTLDRPQARVKRRDNLFVGASCLAHFEAEDAIEHGYATNVLWGSDYPHPEGTYQYPRYEGEPSISKLAMRDACTP